MVQPPPDPAARSAGWVGRLRKILDLNGDRPIFVVVEGDDVALASLYQELTRRGPVVVAMEGTALRGAAPGSCVVYRLDPAEAAWLNLARPFVETRRLRVFGWVKPGELPAMRQAAPDFMDWASHVLVAPPEAPDWLRRNVAAISRTRGILSIGDVELVARALDPMVRVDPTRPWPEIEAAITHPGWRIYTPVADVWSAQRVAWAELLAPGEHPALVSGDNELFPTAREITTRPLDPATPGALERGLDPGSSLSPPRRGRRSFGFPFSAPRGEYALPLEAWSAGHADIARALLSRRHDGGELLRMVDEVGLPQTLWARNPAFRRDNWAHTFRRFILKGVLEARSRGDRRPLPPYLLNGASVMNPREADLLERATERAFHDGDAAWLTAVRDTPIRRPARESELVRLHDLRACLTALDDPPAALATWERVVLPGFQRLDWRDRIACVQASIGAVRLRLGDLSGALAAVEPVKTTPEGARVAAAVLRLRNEPDAATEVLREAGLSPPAPPSRVRIGTTWIA